jgi:flagellar hook protein FlgE
VQGGVETTNSPTDMAIQGRGLFVLRDAQGASFYSRAGQFILDDLGNLVNPSGLFVQGVQLDSLGNPMSGLQNIVISQTVVSPTETTEVDVVANLDATNSSPVAALPADVVGTADTPSNWFAGANFSTVVTIFDSLGQGHDMTMLFRKTTTANQWEYRIVANGGEITGGTAGELEQVSGAGGLLAFNL